MRRFLTVDTLIRDLDFLAQSSTYRALAWRPEDDRVGASLISIAPEKRPTELVLDPAWQPSASQVQAARRFILVHFLAANADHYQMLGVPRSGDSALIRKNYQRLMTLVHPDAGHSWFPYDAAARVNKAYATLSEPTLRAAYDGGFPRASPPAASSVRSVPPSSPAQSDGVVLRPKSVSWFATLGRFARPIGFRRGVFATGLVLAVALAFGLYAFFDSTTRPTLVARTPPPSPVVAAEPIPP
ncbi:MAG: J domain-containing protein, partial [Casimicrobium sp.]